MAYQDNSYTHHVAVQVLFGAIGASGKLPVTVNESYPIGTGIKTPGNIRLQFGFPENAGLSSEKLIIKVDSIVNEGLDSLAFPGCQVLIARKGVVVLDKCYGFHLFDSTQAVTEYDLWDLASVTKVSAATPSLMLLDDRGTFDPDKTLGSYLPWFRFSDKGDLVVREMLAHQAGLIPFIPFYRSTMENDSTFKRGIFSDYTNRKFALTVTDSMYMNRHYLKDMFREIRDSPLGNRKYVYSDLNFILASEIIESITDSTVDKFAPANIYRPIGAFNITYNPGKKYPVQRIVPTEYDSIFRKQLIWGTVHDEGAAMLGGVSGHAGLFATGNDLLKLVEMYRRGGEYGGVRVLSSDVLKEYTTVQFPENDNRRGLGFDKPLLGNDTVPPGRLTPALQPLRQASATQGSPAPSSGLIPSGNILCICQQQGLPHPQPQQHLQSLNQGKNPPGSIRFTDRMTADWYCLLPTKKKSCFTQLFFIVCPGQDSNLHTLTSTSPSSWRVYQFHHLGVVLVPRTGLEPAHHC